MNPAEGAQVKLKLKCKILRTQVQLRRVDTEVGTLCMKNVPVGLRRPPRQDVWEYVIVGGDPLRFPDKLMSDLR